MTVLEKETQWWDEGLYFSCTGCGYCCKGEPGIVAFTDAEIEAAAEALGVSPDRFRELYMWKKYGILSLKERENYDCIFLEEGTDRCMIYSVRPSQCSSFPFWPEVLKSKFAWDRYSQSCPGMNQGRHHSKAEITEYLVLCSK